MIESKVLAFMYVRKLEMHKSEKSLNRVLAADVCEKDHPHVSRFFGRFLTTHLSSCTALDSVRTAIFALSSFDVE
jgi:hypothetical protein